MNAAFWVGFFRDAGIPSSLARSYAATFEENRIGKDMLLDLDKGILADMGIKVMGDVIGILKHAKKEARKDCPVSGTKHNPKPSSAVHSTQSAPQAPAVSTTSSPLQAHSDEGFMGEGELMVYQDREQEMPVEEHDIQSVDQYNTLHSDQLLQHVLTAVAQQQVQQQQRREEQLVEQEEEKDEELVGQVNPALLGLQDEFEEEYVTEAYKRQQQKRALGTLYSDVIFTDPQSKQPRLVILPQDDSESGVDNVQELQIMATPPIVSDTSSRRMLEAAGLVKREHIHISPSADKTTVSSSVSVFSRLDRKNDTSPAKTFSQPPSSTSAVSPTPVKRTIVTAPSPSPKKLSLRVTSKEGRRVSGNSSSSSDGRGGMSVSRKAGAKRELSGGGLVSSSSGSSKETAKSRLGLRTSGEHGGGSRGGGGDSIHWPDAVSTSIAAVSNSGRLSTRLGGSSGGMFRDTATAASRKTRRTMIADSASNPQPKASARLGMTHKPTRDQPAVSSATRARSLRKPKSTPASMVADEYEMKRQLDIRSRLTEKEKQVEERRGGPLHGRLGQHHVFQRLT